MPYKIPPHEFDFKPGQSGNPGGKPKNMISKLQLKALISKLSRFTKKELNEMKSDENIPMLEVMLASFMVKIAEQGDAFRLETLLSRMVGKVKEEKDSDHLDEMNEEELIKYIVTKYPGAFRENR